MLSTIVAVIRSTKTTESENSGNCLSETNFVRDPLRAATLTKKVQPIASLFIT